MGLELAKAFVRVRGDSSRLVPDLKKIQPEAENAIGSMVASLNGILATIGLGIGASLIAKMGFAVATAAEDMEVVFTTLLGGSQKALNMLGKLSDFAAKTPFDLPGVQRAARGLLVFGESTETVLDTLRILGDAAAGGGARFEEVALIFNQVRGVGRLLAQDFKQLSQRGIVSMADFAKHLGVSIEKATELRSKGEITFEDLRAVLEKLTGEGGKFENQMAKLSETTTGILSNIKDDFQRVLTAAFRPWIEQGLKPILKFMGANLTMFLKWGAAVGVAIGVIVAITAVTKAWASVQVVLLALLDPKKLVIGLIAGAAALGLMTKALRPVEAAAAKAAGEQKDMGKEIEKVTKVTIKQVDAVKKLTDALTGLPDVPIERIGVKSDKFLTRLQSLLSIAVKLNPELKNLSSLAGKLARPGDIDERGLSVRDPRIEFTKRFQGSAQSLLDLFNAVQKAASNPQKELDKLNDQLRDLVVLGIVKADDASKLFFDTWKKSPFGKAADSLNEMKEELFRLKNNLSEVQIAIREFSKMPLVTPEQIEQAKRVQKEMEKIRKNLELEEAGKQLERDLATPVEKSVERINEAQKLLDKGKISKETFARLLEAEHKGLEQPKQQQQQILGSVGFADFGKQIQNAILRNDPQKEIAKNSKKQVKLQEDIVRLMGRFNPNRAAALVGPE